LERDRVHRGFRLRLINAPDKGLFRSLPRDRFFDARSDRERARGLAPSPSNDAGMACVFARFDAANGSRESWPATAARSPGKRQARQI
jgi:hypothetical protein